MFEAIKNNVNTDKPDFGKFISYILQFDETAVILKCHLRLEQEIDRAIKKVVPYPEAVLKWSFYLKVEFLYSLGKISKDITSKIKGVNTIRNKFSHTYGYRLSKSDLKFFESFLTNKNLVIPEKMKRVPYIKETTMIACACVYLEGYLVGLIPEINKKSHSSKE